MNLLEKMKLISKIETVDANENAINTKNLCGSILICSAVLAAMDEIEKRGGGFDPTRSELSFCDGIEVALSILRKHLEGNRDVNSVKNTIQSEDNDWKKDAERLANVLNEKPIDEIFSLFYQDIADKTEKALEAHRTLVEKEGKNEQ